MVITQPPPAFTSRSYRNTKDNLAVKKIISIYTRILFFKITIFGISNIKKILTEQFQFVYPSNLVMNDIGKYLGLSVCMQVRTNPAASWG